MLAGISIRRKLALILLTATFGLVVACGLLLQKKASQMRQDRIDKVRAIAETAVSLAARLEAEVAAGRLQRPEAQARWRTTLQGMWYDGDEYLFAVRLDGTMVSHAARPALDGTSVWERRDPNGTPLFQVMSAVVRAQGGGVVEYVWPRAGSDVAIPKISWVQGFAPWDLYVGTGVYLADMQAELLRAASARPGWRCGAVRGPRHCAAHPAVEQKPPGAGRWRDRCRGRRYQPARRGGRHGTLGREAAGSIAGSGEPAGGSRAAGAAGHRGTACRPALHRRQS